MIDPLAGIDEVPWARLKTAYGTAEDTPAVLRTLARADVDEDTRMDAWDYLQSTLLHQGSVFEATAHAIPFVVKLARHADVPDGFELVTWLRHVTAAARNAHAIRAALKEAVPDLLHVIHADTGYLLRELAYVLGADTPPALAQTNDAFVPREAGEFVVLALEGRATEAQRAAAIARIDGSGDDAVDVAAAYMLLRCASDSSALPARVHELATPGRIIALRRDASVRESALFDVELPPPPMRAPEDAVLEDATVVFAGVDLLLVEHATRGRFTVRARGTGLAKGEVVRLGAFTSVLGNVARIAEIRGVRYLFDERGMPIAR